MASDVLMQQLLAYDDHYRRTGRSNYRKLSKIQFEMLQHAAEVNERSAAVNRDAISRIDNLTDKCKRLHEENAVLTELLMKSICGDNREYHC